MFLLDRGLIALARGRRPEESAVSRASIGGGADLFQNVPCAAQQLEIPEPVPNVRYLESLHERRMAAHGRVEPPTDVAAALSAIGSSRPVSAAGERLLLGFISAVIACARESIRTPQR